MRSLRLYAREHQIVNYLLYSTFLHLDVQWYPEAGSGWVKPRSWDVPPGDEVVHGPI